MKKKNRWWLLITPLYLFTLLFVLGPMIYMVAVSFATNNGDGYGFRWIFTLDNYRKEGVDHADQYRRITIQEFQRFVDEAERF